MGFPDFNMDPCHHYPLSFVCSVAKATFAVYTFTLEGITSAYRAVIDHVAKHPCIYGISGAFIVGGILFLLVPTFVGFGPLGPIAGSWAARWQSQIGNVKRGSWFAILQHLTMTGVFDNIGVAMIAMGVMGVLGAEDYLTGRKGERCPIPVMMAQAADFAAEYARYSGEGAADILVRAAGLVAASEFPGFASDAAVVVARAAQLAAQQGVDYYTSGAAKVAEYYGSSGGVKHAGEAAAAAMAQVAGYTGQHGADYYTAGAAKVAEYYGSSGGVKYAGEAAAGVMARVAGFTGQYGFRMV